MRNFVNESGLRGWIFFEKRRFVILITLWRKKFPYLTFAICDKKKQKWWPTKASK
jgi:hypothetical protein